MVSLFKVSRFSIIFYDSLIGVLLTEVATSFPALGDCGFEIDINFDLLRRLIDEFIDLRNNFCSMEASFMFMVM